MDAVERCVENFNQQYPNYREDATTMCPPVFRYGYKAPLSEEASGFNELKPIEKHTLRGDEAEKLVFDALSKCRQPMFVIRGLKFTSLLQSVLGKSFDVEGEIDFVVIHRKIGVLLLEVKAQDNKNNYRKGIEQLDKHKEIIEALLNVLSQTQDSVGNQANSLVESQTQVQNQLEVYKVYVAPNDKLSPNENAAWYLDNEALGDIEKWFESKFSGREFEDSQREVLHKLCCVLVGQRTEITMFLQQSYDKQNEKDRKKRKRKEEEEKVVEELPNMKKRSVVSTREHPGLSCLKGQFMFLNQQQLAVWEGPRHQVIHGVAGSGKTILLQYKALECARKGEKVTVYVPTEHLQCRYEEFFEKNNAQVTVTFCFHPVDLQCNHSCHIFVDECQLLLTDIRIFSWFDLGDVNKIMYFWLAFDNMQVIEWENIGDSARKGKYKESSLMKSIEEVDSKLIERGFEKTVLNTCVRCTTTIFSFIQEYMKYSKVTLVDGYPTMNVGHNIPGEKVKVYVLERANNVLPIQISDIPPTATFCGVTKFTNEDERFGHCVDILMTEMNKKYDSCVVLMSNTSTIGYFNLGNLMKLCSKDVPSVPLFDDVHSCEWKTVFVLLKPGEFLFNYLAMTRAICKLVVIYI
jgi:hypothetical protein